MTILGACEWCLGGPLVLIGLLTALRLGWMAHHRPAAPVPLNRDILAPHAPLYGARRLEMRPVPPVVDPRWELVFGPDTIEVARPLGWDAQPRERGY